MKWIFNHTQLFSELSELNSSQSFSDNIYCLFAYGNVLELYCPTLNTVSDKMTPDVNMFGPIMKYRIFREFDTTLIVTVNAIWLHPAPE